MSRQLFTLDGIHTAGLPLVYMGKELNMIFDLKDENHDLPRITVICDVLDDGGGCHCEKTNIP